MNHLACRARGDLARSTGSGILFHDGARGGLLQWAGEECEPRLRLDVYTLHPDDTALQFEDRPERAGRTGNPHPFKHFLNFARTAGVAKAAPVAGFPVAEGGAGGGE